jgi:hypothetical protein
VGGLPVPAGARRIRRDIIFIKAEYGEGVTD